MYYKRKLEVIYKYKDQQRCSLLRHTRVSEKDKGKMKLSVLTLRPVINNLLYIKSTLTLYMLCKLMFLNNDTLHLKYDITFTSAFAD